MNLMTVVYSFFILFIQLMTPVRAAEVPSHFLYDAETSFFFGQERKMAVSPELEALAKKAYGWLNSSVYFDSKLLGNLKFMRNQHLKKKPNHAEVGRIFTVETVDSVKIECTYFDRGSDTLIVVAEGFTNNREQMSPFIAMFPDVDIVLFDFRGHGTNEAGLFNFAKSLAGIDTSKIRFGLDEDKDVKAVVNGFKKFKQQRTSAPYEKVIGLGLCYGAFILAKSQATHKNLFDKLILDGCWLSLPLFVEKVRSDLLTIANPQSGGWANHWFWGRKIVKNAAELLVTYVLGLKYHEKISFLDFAKDLSETEILFIQGKDDYMIRRHEFEQLWNAIPGENKMLMLTSNEHVRNHLKQKELYKLVSDLFISGGRELAFEVLSEQEIVADYLIESYIAQLVV